MPLLLSLTIVATLALRLLLIVVLIEMREPMRSRGRLTLHANTAAMAAAILLAANSAVGMAAWRGVDAMPPMQEIAARIVMPFATSIALLLVAMLAALGMRGNTR